MEQIFRIIILVIGTIGVINSFTTLMVSNGNLGTYLPAIIGFIFIGFSIFKPSIDKFVSQNIIFLYIRNIIYFGFIFFIITFIACTIFLHTRGTEEPPKNCDAIIVLGAGLNRSRVSTSLAYRLDKAFEYANENKNSIIIVSGGQGKGEERTESSAMKEYLINKGISEERIYEENKSTNTVENFTFSKNILDKIFNGNNYKTVYVTNDFHIFRAGLIAKKCGFTAYGLGAQSYKPLIFNFYIREYFSIIKFFIFDR